MKLSRASIMVFSLNFFVFQSSNAKAFINTSNICLSNVFDKSEVNPAESVPIAKNDTFVLNISNGNNFLHRNVMINDSLSNIDNVKVSLAEFPRIGSLIFSSNGDFKFTNSIGFTGIATFKYKLCSTINSDYWSIAEVIIYINYDNDWDGIPDEDDIDDDNDGILDIDEGLKTDTDKDGFPNYLDIDSDNDGIPDNIEGQSEGDYFAPRYNDTDRDGWDDAYDPDNNGNYFELADTDLDGTPDFLDTNSDNDAFDDLTEGYNAVLDSINKISYSGIDFDFDGLDNSFDIIEGWLNLDNSIGSNAPLPDFDNNGVRDWRDFTKKGSIPGQGNPLQGVEIFSIFPNPSNGTFKN